MREGGRRRRSIPYLTDILVHLLVGEWLLSLVVTKQPETRSPVVVVVCDVQVVRSGLQDGIFLWPTVRLWGREGGLGNRE